VCAEVGEERVGAAWEGDGADVVGGGAGPGGARRAEGEGDGAAEAGRHGWRELDAGSCRLAR
jgi:hypothetical protein